MVQMYHLVQPYPNKQQKPISQKARVCLETILKIIMRFRIKIQKKTGLDSCFSKILSFTWFFLE